MSITKGKKILILTGHFTPELHPRAFRAHELACELARRNHNVNVVTLTNINSFDYRKYEIENKLQVLKLKLYERSANIMQRKLPRSKVGFFINKAIKWIVDYIIGGNLFIYAFKIKKQLNLNEYDIVISLSTPFMNLLGVAISRSAKTKHKRIFIADSGDPFYRSQQTKRAPYFYLLEKYVYSKYDFLTIPHKNALEAYKGLIDNEKIKIIPQGFNLKGIKLTKPSGQGKVHFAYSGVFYLDIRNPIFLFECLKNLDFDFKFHLYLREYNSSINALLLKYKPFMGSKLKVTYGLNREELLFKLSRMDFLINIDNLTNNQIPSKLIDYAITERPIYSCNSKNFSLINLKNFLNRDYSNSLNINKEDFDIKKIANQFLQLYDLKITPKKSV